VDDVAASSTVRPERQRPEQRAGPASRKGAPPVGRVRRRRRRRRAASPTRQRRARTAGQHAQFDVSATDRVRHQRKRGDQRRLHQPAGRSRAGRGRTPTGRRLGPPQRRGAAGATTGAGAAASACDGRRAIAQRAGRPRPRRRGFRHRRDDRTAAGDASAARRLDGPGELGQGSRTAGGFLSSALVRIGRNAGGPSTRPAGCSSASSGSRRPTAIERQDAVSSS